MDSLPQNKTLNLYLTLLASAFTILASVAGAAFFAVTYIPLSRNQVHGREAVVIYKSINILGLILAPLGFAVGAICIAIIKCRLSASHAQPPSTPPQPLLPPRPSLADWNAAERPRPAVQTKGQMEWNAIEQPDYEYMNELVLALVREKKKGKEQLLVDV